MASYIGSRKRNHRGLKYLGFPKLTANYEGRLILCKKYLLIREKRENTTAITFVNLIMVIKKRMNQIRIRGDRATNRKWLTLTTSDLKKRQISRYRSYTSCEFRYSKL